MKKVKLLDLDVKSFVTSIKEEEQSLIKGGFSVSGCQTPPQRETVNGEICNTETIIPTRCGCTGYYPSLNAPC